MIDPGLTIRILPESFAISRLSAGAPVPAWASGGSLVSVTRTRDELSIVSEESLAPEGATREPGWRGLKVEGPLDFSLVGILASIITPLAEAGISIFAVSTYDTDYVLVKSGDLAEAVSVLERSGHIISKDRGQER
ncbi:MAG TPA: ACT domain-containing protein [Blastocatellia bacterium]|nr:ACT domain-containing protein [Blastocatellia bacterium]